MHANWLFMAYRGLCGLEAYNPSNRGWGQVRARAAAVIEFLWRGRMMRCRDGVQAHSYARFAILRVLLAAGGGLVTIKGLPELVAAKAAGSVSGVRPWHGLAAGPHLYCQ